MKRTCAFILCVIVFFTCAVLPASANSGPTYMPSEPGLSMTVDKGCPITVEHENLVFDFSGVTDSWSPVADVTASYTMLNPTDETVSVTMAFPYITSFSSNGETDVKAVSVDGQAVDFTVYYGSTVSSDTEYNETSDTYSTVTDLSNLDLDDVLGSVITQCPSEPDGGTLYTITPSLLSGEADRVHIRLKLEGGRYYSIGFGGYSGYDDGSVLLTSWFYFGNDDGLYFFVPDGESVSYSVTAHESYDSNDELENVSLQVTSRICSFRELIELGYGSFAPEDPSKFESLYWAVLTDEALGLGKETGSVSEMIYDSANADRLAMAVYTVDFSPNERKEISVSCGLGGTMNRPSGYSSVGITHTYTYLSNPAKNWAAFGSLDITVVPPESMPVSSSIPELAQLEDGTCHALLPGLPEENITFTLGQPATEAELREISVRNTARSIVMFAPIFIPLGTVILMAAAVIIYFKCKKKRK